MPALRVKAELALSSSQFDPNRTLGRADCSPFSHALPHRKVLRFEHRKGASSGGSMKRCEFITLVTGAVTSWPLVAHSQQAAIPVVGYAAPTFLRIPFVRCAHFPFAFSPLQAGEWFQWPTASPCAPPG